MLEHPDLTDIPFQNPELEIFTDRSSFIQDGQCKTGYAITATDEIVKAAALPQGGQHNRLSEPWALTQALRPEGSESTSTLIQGMPLPLHIYMEPLIKQGDHWPQEERRLKTKKKSFSC